ncbi:NAD-dependent epimerase/dehydratase family protein [Streptomyces sp. NBC_01764]|uniref:SDR family oxidoreductase n=1 Tax=unclassified Streptomyces TaxID=2593676 RepID=UPI00225A7C16|nr:MULTISPECIES: NAD(P)H-binding protein [unclassified Streptomyces]MCX4404224.1 NAD-dependent epimerase/dehydratase family protein [Streptomyces sp. NBC_01764]
MRVVVAGATGLIGSRTVARLRDHGVEVVPVSRREGVDVITGQGLIAALRGADVVVDVTDAPSRAEGTSVEFFGTSTGNLLEAAAATGIEHYVALSVVGADRVQQGYFRAKAVQEERARRSPIPHSLVRAMPFFESVDALSRSTAHADGVHVAPVLIRPVSTDDVAAELAHVAVGLPLFGVLEIVGPEEYPLDDLAAKLQAARGDIRGVVTDARAPFFGALVAERSLLPRATAHPGHETLAHWLARR